MFDANKGGKGKGHPMLVMLDPFVHKTLYFMANHELRQTNGRL